jgi:hypothetical protein
MDNIMSNFKDFIGGGGGSNVNDVKYTHSAANLITTESGEVWLKGGVSETDLTTYPDATTSITYSNAPINFAPSTGWAVSKSITWDGTYFWVAATDNYVYKFNASGVFQSNFSVSSQTSNPQGIVWDGSHLWVVGYSQQALFKYNTSGVYQNVSISISQNTGPRDVAWDGTHFYVLNNSTARVYKYSAAGSYIGNFLVSSQDSSPFGITWDGTYFWVIGATTVNAYAYNSSFVYQNKSFYFATQETIPYGAGAQGSSVWVVGNNKTAYKYAAQIGCGARTEGTGNNLYTRIK